MEIPATSSGWAPSSGCSTTAGAALWRSDRERSCTGFA